MDYAVQFRDSIETVHLRQRHNAVTGMFCKGITHAKTQ
jgi:hypothetical protein